MKKVILVFCFVIGLNASDMMCKNVYGSFLKYDDLFTMAFERKDYDSMKIYSSMRIRYIENAIVECSHKPYLDKLKSLRANSIHVSNLINGVADAD